MSNDLLTRPRLEVDTEELTRQRAKLLPPYKVILFNDDKKPNILCSLLICQAVPL
jgi:hypothetical protein